MMTKWCKNFRPTRMVGLLFLTACASAATPTPVGEWIQRANMRIERSWIGMASVAGKIYGLGGMTGSDGRRLDLTEMYDPAKNEWTLKASMPTARSSPGTAVVGDLIYVMGGYPEDGVTDVVEVYDTVNDRWTTGALSMPTKRFDLSAVAIGNSIYTIGGYNGGPINAFEAYDVTTTTWSKLPPMPTARYALQAVVIDDRIWAIGGRTNDDATAVIEIFDPKTKTWSTASTQVPEPLAGFGAAMADGILHVVKYDKHFAYDPQTNKWQTHLTPMPTSRHGLQLAYIGGLLYAVGGCMPDGNNLFDVARNEAFIIQPR